MSVAAGGAAAAAAAHQAEMRKEEEKLTSYNSSDLDGWEFKIVRSSARIKGDKFRQLCQEEAENGWELVEKFDDYRVRFKRRVERRQLDRHATLDPYRTTYGLSEGKVVLIVLSVALVIAMGVVLLVVMLNR
ncbi:MAG: hypothetical protein ACOX2K_04235 [Bacillota bacterium]|jgi:hypothetical protein